MIPPISAAPPASLPVIVPPASTEGKTTEVARKKLSGAQKRQRRKQNQAAEAKLTSSMVAGLKDATPDQLVEWTNKVKAMTVEERKQYQDETTSFLVKEAKIPLALAQQKAKANIDRMLAADTSSTAGGLRSFAQIYQQMSDEEKAGQQQIMIELGKKDGKTEVEAARIYAELVQQALSLLVNK